MFICRAVARALIGGGRVCIVIYSCSARLISFQINLKTTDFKRNPSGITPISVLAFVHSSLCCCSSS